MGKLKTGDIHCNVVTIFCPACNSPLSAPTGGTTRQTRDNHVPAGTHVFCANPNCGEKYRTPDVLERLI